MFLLPLGSSSQGFSKIQETKQKEVFNKQKDYFPGVARLQKPTYVLPKVFFSNIVFEGNEQINRLAAEVKSGSHWSAAFSCKKLTVPPINALASHSIS